VRELVIQPEIRLEGHGVRLDPLTPADDPELFAATPPDTFRYFPWQPREWTLDAFGEFMDGARSDQTRRAFVVRAGGAVVGCSSYLDIRPRHLGVEVGATWYAASARGTFVNPACKLLLLGHAFDVMGCERVQLKCDARNERSARGIAGIGATFEGSLRRHMVMPDGHLRDTAMFSIIRPEWPAVRARLLARLGAAG
jgi:N-acetyltransferase